MLHVRYPGQAPCNDTSPTPSPRLGACHTLQSLTSRDVCRNWINLSARDADLGALHGFDRDRKAHFTLQSLERSCMKGVGIPIECGVYGDARCDLYHMCLVVIRLMSTAGGRWRGSARCSPWPAPVPPPRRARPRARC